MGRDLSQTTHLNDIIVAAVVEFQKENNRGASTNELADLMGFRSRSAMAYHIGHLVKSGQLVKHIQPRVVYCAGQAAPPKPDVAALKTKIKDGWQVHYYHALKASQNRIDKLTRKNASLEQQLKKALDNIETLTNELREAELWERELWLRLTPPPTR